MAIKQFIVILAFLCCVTSDSLCGNCYMSRIESPDPMLIDNKSGYTISASSESITISSLTTGSQVWVYDSSGRNVYNKTAKSDFITVPIRSKGIFIIRIKTDNDISTTKILIK